jgi:hypothetical protein
MEQNLKRRTTKKDYFILIIISVIFISFISCSIEEMGENQPPDAYDSIIQPEEDQNSSRNNNKCEIKYEKIVNKFYKYLQKGRSYAVSALFTRNALLFINGQPEIIPMAGTYSGKWKIRKYFHTFQQRVKIQSIEFQYNLKSYNKVSSHVNIIGYVNETGKIFDLEYVFLFEMNRINKIKKLTVLYDTYIFNESFIEGEIDYISDIKVSSDDFSIYDIPFDCEAIVRLSFDPNTTPVELTSILSNDVEVTFKCPTEIPFAGSYYYIEGVFEWLSYLYGTMYPIYQDRYLYITDGNRVDIFINEAWTVYETGKSFEIKVFNSYRLNNEGKLCGFISINDSKAVNDAFIP